MKWIPVQDPHMAIFREIWDLLNETYDDYGAILWLNSRNRNLGMEKPIEMINSGRGLAVREAAYALEGGG